MLLPHFSSSSGEWVDKHAPGRLIMAFSACQPISIPWLHCLFPGTSLKSSGSSGSSECYKSILGNTRMWLQGECIGIPSMKLRKLSRGSVPHACVVRRLRWVHRDKPINPFSQPRATHYISASAWTGCLVVAVSYMRHFAHWKYPRSPFHPYSLRYNTGFHVIECLALVDTNCDCEAN